MGDSIMLQRYYPEKPQERIGQLFGREFAKSVFALEPGRWHGPVLSGYGTHLVYVQALREFPVPGFDDVREQVAEDWTIARRTEITERYFDDTLARYDVEVEGMPEFRVVMESGARDGE